MQDDDENWTGLRDVRSGGGGPRRRLPPEERAQDFVTSAASYFAEVGFEGSTRELARRLGVTQPLLYRYFPSKDQLIEAVYRKVYLDRWDPAWDVLLKDRTRPVRQRFETFYDAYTDTIFEPEWLRLYFFASLRDAQINRWYNHVVEELILKRLVREYRVELGLDQDGRVSREELEPVWLMHGGLLHYGVRKHILGFRVLEDKTAAIARALDMYFAVAELTLAGPADDR